MGPGPENGHPFSLLVSTAEASVIAVFVILVAIFVDRKIPAFLEQMEKMSYPES